MLLTTLLNISLKKSLTWITSLSLFAVSCATVHAEFNGFITTDVLPLYGVAEGFGSDFFDDSKENPGVVAVALAKLTDSGYVDLIAIDTDGKDSLVFIFLGDGTGSYENVYPFVFPLYGMVATSLATGTFDLQNSNSHNILVAGASNGNATVKLIDVNAIPCFFFIACEN